MPVLSGFLNATRVTTGFLVPLFSSQDRGNSLFIQTLSDTGIVSGFAEFEPYDLISYSGERVVREVGDQGLWAFQFNEGRIAIGSAGELQSQLLPMLDEFEAMDFPWLKVEISSLYSWSPTFPEVLRGAYYNLADYSKEAANIWRDSVVLLPIVKKELHKIVENRRRQISMDGVRVVGTRQTLVVELPPSFSDLSDLAVHKMTKSITVANAFGLKKVVFRQMLAGPSTRVSDIIPRIYGKVYPLSGTGYHVAEMSTNSWRPFRIVAPSGQRFRDDTKQVRPPLLTFAVLNSTSAQIDSAINIAKGAFDPRTAKIAIVMRPTGYGTPRKSTPDLDEVGNLHDHYDYVFIIANHLLQKPAGTAGTLDASIKAVRFGRSCINGLMQLVWSQTGPKSSKSVYGLLPRDNFCLVGRGVKQKTEAVYLGAMRRAFDSMLHERLPLSDVKALAIISNENPDDVRKFACDISGIDAARILSFRAGQPATHRGITMLAFGLEQQNVNARIFERFCLTLLTSFGWTISAQRFAFFEASLGRQEMTFAFATDVDRAQKLFNDLVRADQSPLAVILTNFTPPRSMVTAFDRHDVTICHYGLFEIRNREVRRRYSPRS
jgi:hypothetical protein